MLIPAGAYLDNRKLYEYLLVPLPHDDKSGYLARAGFDLTTAPALRDAILELSTTVAAKPGQTTQYGAKWVVSGIMQGPNGVRLPVRLIWLQHHADGRFRFVTLVPGLGD